VKLIVNLGIQRTEAQKIVTGLKNISDFNIGCQLIVDMYHMGVDQEGLIYCHHPDFLIQRIGEGRRHYPRSHNIADVAMIPQFSGDWVIVPPDHKMKNAKRFNIRQALVTLDDSYVLQVSQFGQTRVELL